ncbi:MAG: DUF370 domain-containing protein [Clostridia bacterium]|nr:DUF370 domain-containing protein [Clostridia bacterium]
MYVHIGNDEILNRDDIIAVLDLSQIKHSRQNLRIINEMKARNNPSDQSVIIIQRNNKEERIFTNIAVSTLRKRLSTNAYTYFPEEKDI